MNDRRDFHEDTQRWLDGVPGTSPHAEDRAAAERLREAGDQFARSLDVPGPEVDAVVMAVVENLDVKAIEELVASYEARRGPLAEALENQPEI